MAKKVQGSLQVLAGPLPLHPLADHRGDFMQQFEPFLLGVGQAGWLNAFGQVQGGPEPGKVCGIPRSQQ